MNQHESKPEYDVGFSTTRREALTRGVLVGVGALGAALVSSTSAASKHDGHQHEPETSELQAAAIKCTSTAQQCLAHCLSTFKDGDTSLGPCATKINEMISICEAFSQQVAANSEYAESLAPVCRQACKDCEKFCRKNEDKHAHCKACADACADLVAAIDAAYG